MTDPNSNANSSPEKLGSGSESHPPSVMGSAEEPPQPSLSNITTTVSSAAGNIISEELLTTRPLKMTDAPEAVKWLMDKEASRFCPWYAFESNEEATEYFEKEYLSYSEWHHAICISDKAVGSICVNQLEKEDKCRAEIAYVVSPKYWGRGLATWAVREAAKKVFADQKFKDLLRLEAQVDVDNKASQRVVEKAGFTKEGVLRKYFLMKEIPKDIVIFSLLRTDPASTSTSST